MMSGDKTVPAASRFQDFSQGSPWCLFLLNQFLLLLGPRYHVGEQMAMVTGKASEPQVALPLGPPRALWLFCSFPLLVL